MIRDQTTLDDDLMAKTGGAACKLGSLSSHPQIPQLVLTLRIDPTVVAGAETTSAFIQYFIYAMLMYPEVQKKAQAEIDRVVGSDRLPTVDE